MPTASNGDDAFRLEFSGVIADTIRRLQRRASREGRGKEFLSAIRKIAKRLRTKPATFGEPVYRLPNLRMQIRSAVVGPIYVDFARRSAFGVHQSREVALRAHMTG
jgi:hypothetical protein